MHHSHVLGQILRARIQDEDNMPKKLTIYVPRILQARWAKHIGTNDRPRLFSYDLTRALEWANVSIDKFSYCWKYIRSRILSDDIFRMLQDSGLGQNDRNLEQKAVFINNVLQRYEDIATEARARERVFLKCICVFIWLLYIV